LLASISSNAATAAAAFAKAATFHHHNNYHHHLQAIYSSHLALFDGLVVTLQQQQQQQQQEEHDEETALLIPPQLQQQQQQQQQQPPPLLQVDDVGNGSSDAGGSDKGVGGAGSSGSDDGLRPRVMSLPSKTSTNSSGDAGSATSTLGHGRPKSETSVLIDDVGVSGGGSSSSSFGAMLSKTLPIIGRGHDAPPSTPPTAPYSPRETTTATLSKTWRGIKGFAGESLHASAGPGNSAATRESAGASGGGGSDCDEDGWQHMASSTATATSAVADDNGDHHDDQSQLSLPPTWPPSRCTVYVTQLLLRVAAALAAASGEPNNAVVVNGNSEISHGSGEVEDDGAQRAELRKARRRMRSHGGSGGVRGGSLSVGNSGDSTGGKSSAATFSAQLTAAPLPPALRDAIRHGSVIEVMAAHRALSIRLVVPGTSATFLLDNEATIVTFVAALLRALRTPLLPATANVHCVLAPVPAMALAPILDDLPPERAALVAAVSHVLVEVVIARDSDNGNDCSSSGGGGFRVVAMAVAPSCRCLPDVLFVGMQRCYEHRRTATAAKGAISTSQTASTPASLPPASVDASTSGENSNPDTSMNVPNTVSRTTPDGAVELPKLRFLGVGCALYDYDADGDDELTMSEGDFLLIVSDDDAEDGDRAGAVQHDTDEWMRVLIRGQCGVVPRTFVTERTARTATAQYAYVKEDDDEVPLGVGELVFVLDEDVGGVGASETSANDGGGASGDAGAAAQWVRGVNTISDGGGFAGALPHAYVVFDDTISSAVDEGNGEVAGADGSGCNGTDDSTEVDAQ